MYSNLKFLWNNFDTTTLLWKLIGTLSDSRSHIGSFQSRILSPNLNNSWMTTVIGGPPHVTGWITIRLVGVEYKTLSKTLLQTYSWKFCINYILWQNDWWFSFFLFLLFDLNETFCLFLCSASDNSPYIEVNFGKDTVVFGAVVQKRCDHPYENQYVTSYKIQAYFSGFWEDVHRQVGLISQNSIKTFYL